MPLVPSTNNGLESINATIKREHTFRARLALALFLKTKLEIANKWSKEHDLSRVNHKKVAKEPESTENHALNVLAYGLKKSKIHTLILRENGNVHYFINATENKKNKIYQDVTKEEMNKCHLALNGQLEFDSLSHIKRLVI
jgi:hypothetical protein